MRDLIMISIGFLMGAIAMNIFVERQIDSMVEERIRNEISAYVESVCQRQLNEMLNKLKEK